jgi:hypothetical protein
MNREKWRLITQEAKAHPELQRRGEGSPLNEHVASIFRLEELAMQETRLLALAFMLVYRLDYASILKMKAIYSSGTSVDFQRTIRRYFPEEKNSS